MTVPSIPVQANPSQPIPFCGSHPKTAVSCHAKNLKYWKSPQEEESKNQAVNQRAQLNHVLRVLAGESRDGLASATKDKTTLPQLLVALEDENPEVRLQAVKKLGDLMNPPVKVVLPRIVVRLEDQDPRVQFWAAVLIAYISDPAGPEAAKAVPIFRNALKGKDGKLSSEALSALTKIGPAAWQALPDLLTLLQKELKSPLRLAILEALQSIGPYAPEAIPVFMELLKNQELSVRQLAALALGRYGRRAKEAIPALLATLKETRWTGSIFEKNYLEAVASSMAMIAREEKSVIPPIVAVLGEPEMELRWGAMVALAQMGADAGAAVPLLIEILKKDDPRGMDHVLALRVLGSIGPAAKPAFPQLLNILSGDYDFLLVETAEALGAIGPEAAAALPKLMAIHQNKSGFLDIYNSHGADIAVSQAIVQIANPSSSEFKTALHTLGDYLLRSPEDYVRMNAAEALAKIGPKAEAACSSLVAAMEDESQEVRFEALEALYLMGPGAEPAIPALMAALKNQRLSPLVQRAILRVVIDMGDAAKRAIPALVDLLKIKGKEFKKEVAAALSTISFQIVSEAPEAVKALALALGDEHPWIRRQAITALVRMKCDIQQAEAALIRSLDDEEVFIRLQAVKAMARLKPSDAVVQNKLEEISNDPNPTVRREALRTLRLLQNGISVE